MDSIYLDLKNRQPEMFECFFAFSKTQFEEGKKKAEISDKKILSGGYGLYGTKEGIDRLMSFYDNISAEISAKCNPQDVYDDEFNNHECGYVGDDNEAIKLVIAYFGVEKAKLIKRKCGYITIDDIKL